MPVILNRGKKMKIKDKERVRKYLASGGFTRFYYYIVIALTMGNVDRAVEQYLNELDMEREEEAYVPTPHYPMGDSRCGYVPTPTLEVDEEEETEDINAITAAILAEHQANYPDTAEYETEPQADGWSGFGGGGDFGGGGAGGSWSPSNDVASNDTPTPLTDSY